VSIVYEEFCVVQKKMAELENFYRSIYDSGQETGDEFVDKIEGSFTNVMGLSMELVEKIFKSLENCL
jgi:hypothetical protein